MTRFIVTVFAIAMGASFAVVFAPHDARADVVFEDEVETCTKDKVIQPGEECVQCSAYHAEPKKCEKHGSEGFEKRCQTRSASAWTEIWCKTSTVTSSAVNQVPKKKGRSASCATGASQEVGLALLALLIAGLAARRLRSQA